MKKKIIVVIFAILFAFSLLFCTAVTSFADEKTEQENGVSTSENAILTEDAGASDTDDSEESAEAPAKSAEETNAYDAKEDGEKNFLAQIVAQLRERASDFFSAGAFFSALAIAFAYKRGLIPILRGALEKLHGGVKQLGEEAGKQSAAAEAFEKELLKNVSATGDEIARVTASLAELEKKLPDREAQAGERAVFFEVLNAQIDLLSEVFLGSSLPQYEKDRVGERVLAMKRAIAPEADHAGKDD